VIIKQINFVSKELEYCEIIGMVEALIEYFKTGEMEQSGMKESGVERSGTKYNFDTIV
jgi:hypothetical protein